jgi:uncharacterized coiled-coil protein SlyX
MKIITTLASSAIGLLLMGASAHAACNVTVTSFPGVLTNPFTETDCASAATVASQGAAIGALQTNDAAQDATLATHGTTLTDHEGRITTLEGDSASHGLAITALQSASAAHAVTLADHETRIGAAETKNSEQDGRLDGHDTMLTSHGNRITATETTNAQQDVTLAAHGATLVSHGTAISNLQSENAAQWAAIDAGVAKDAQQDKRINDLSEEMAEGLAMVAGLHIPHVEKSFAASLSGGFYEGSTAVGGAAAIRIDQHWQFGGAVTVGTETGRVAGKAAVTGQW